MFLPKISNLNLRKTFFNNFIQTPLTSNNININSFSFNNNWNQKIISNFNNKPNIYKLYSEEKENNLSGPKFPYKQPSKIKDTRLIKTKFKTRNLKSDFINITTNDYYNSKFSTQIEKELDSLILRKSNKLKNENENKKIKNQKFNLDYFEDYRNFIIKKNNKEEMRILSSKIIEKIENMNKLENINLKITNNYYFDKIINQIIRKVIYYSSKNEKIKNDKVINMLYEEINNLENETNKNMELHCKIKNFSTVILKKDYKITLIPLINSVHPLSKNELNKLNKSFYKTEMNEKKNILAQSLYNNTKINNKSINEKNEIKSENNSKFNLNENENNNIGIWDLYNKEQNKKSHRKSIKNFGIKINIDGKRHYNFFIKDEKGNLTKVNEIHSDKIYYDENGKIVENIQEKIFKIANNNNNDLNDDNYENSDNENVIENKKSENINYENYKKKNINSENDNESFFENKNNDLKIRNNNLKDYSNFSINKTKESLNENSLSNIQKNLNSDINHILGGNQLQDMNNPNYKKIFKERKGKKKKSEKSERSEKSEKSEKNEKSEKKEKKGKKEKSANKKDKSNSKEKKNKNKSKKKKLNLDEKIEIEEDNKEEKEEEEKEEEKEEKEERKIEEKKMKSPKKRKSQIKLKKIIKNKKIKEEENESLSSDSYIEELERKRLNLNKNSFSFEEEEEEEKKEEEIIKKKNTWGLVGIKTYEKKKENKILENKENNFINNNNYDNNININDKKKIIENNKNLNKEYNSYNFEKENSKKKDLEENIIEGRNIEKQKSNFSNYSSTSLYSLDSNNSSLDNNENNTNKMINTSNYKILKNKNLLNEIDEINEKKKKFNTKKKRRRTLNFDYNNPKSKFYKKKKLETKIVEIPKTKIEKNIKKIEEADLNTQIKDLQIIEEIKFKMNKELSLEGKKLYQELLNNIQKLKETDVNSYVHSLESGFDIFKGEIYNIEKSREIQNRINLFIDDLNKDREGIKNRRKFYESKAVVKDYKVITELDYRKGLIFRKVNDDFIF